MKTNIVVGMFLLFLTPLGFSQSFINLNFESARIVPTENGWPQIETTNALPGWTVLIGGSQITTITYNAQAVGGTWVSIDATNGLQISGRDSVFLQGGFYPFTAPTAAISQTGLIPISAVSLLFQAQPGPGDLEVSFGSQVLSVFALSTGPNYTLYGADISAFAGQTNALTFSALQNLNAYNGWRIDNIQFSTNAVPEPSMFALIGLGGVLLGFRRWKKRTITRAASSK